MFQRQHDTGAIAAICESHARRRDRLMDIVVDVHRRYGRVDGDLMDDIATELGVPRVDVESIVSFYSFLDTRPRGQFIIRLCNDVIDKLQGADEIAAELERLLEISMGETSPDGMFTLEWTPF
ncbi:NADH:ubiquinone oxidoreductase, partial [bacterium]